MNYAGIGSRETPNWVIDVMEKMGAWLAKKGDNLRSGGADGADSAFERGCDSAYGKKEIFLPWQGFQGRGEKRDGSRNVYCHYDNVDDAIKIAKKYHPYWENLSNGGRALMARNSYQVLGKDLVTPSDFVVCYTEDGKEKGGTAQAMRIAKDKGVPIFNIGNYKEQEVQKVVDDFNKFYLEIKKSKENQKEEEILEER